MADVRCLLSDAADISRHEPAIIASDRRLLYHEFEERTLAAQSNLHRAGYGPGSHIAIWMENDWRYVVLLMAVIRIGGVVVPVSTRWPAKLVGEQLRKVGCRFVIADAARTAAESELQGSTIQFQMLDPEVLLAHPTEPPVHADVRIPLDRPAAIVFSSGSSGAPRAALLTYGNLYYSAMGSNRNIRVASHDKWLLTLPLNHVGGLGIVFRCVMAGATIAFPDKGEAIEDAQARFGATHLSLVSTQLYRLLNAGKLPVAFLAVKAILLGGSAISPAMIAEARRRKLPVFPSYGLTEMASQVTTMRPDSPPAKHETSGKVLKHRDVQIADDGEILVCGATLFRGYVEADGVHSGLDANGWFHTGDIGSLDEEGYLTVRGRKDFMFISGGENIHPEEIEHALARLHDVEQALVVPVENAEFGARPVAFLRTHGAMPKAEQLSVRLGEWLPKFKIPVAFFPWPSELDAELAKADRRRAAELAAKCLKQA